MRKVSLISLTLFVVLSSGLGWPESKLISARAAHKDVVFYRGMRDTLFEERNIPYQTNIANNVVNKGVSSLKVRAYPEQAVTPLDGEQTIYVIVQDQRLEPVYGAQVSLVIRMPSGEEDRIILPTLTNENGITQFVFSYTTKTIGIVEIKVTAVHEKLQGATSTCFWLWW